MRTVEHIDEIGQSGKRHGICPSEHYDTHHPDNPPVTPHFTWLWSILVIYSNTQKFVMV